MKRTKNWNGLIAYTNPKVSYWPFKYSYDYDIESSDGLFVDVEKNNPSKMFWSGIFGNGHANNFLSYFLNL